MTGIEVGDRVVPCTDGGVAEEIRGCRALVLRAGASPTLADLERPGDGCDLRGLPPGDQEREARVKLSEHARSCLRCARALLARVAEEIDAETALGMLCAEGREIFEVQAAEQGLRRPPGRD